MRSLVVATALAILAACSSSTHSPSGAGPGAGPAGAGADGGADGSADGFDETCPEAQPWIDTSTFDPACPVAKPEAPDAFDEALAAAGIDRCKIGYTEKDWSIYPKSLSRDPYRLPWYDEVHDHSMRVPGFGRLVVDQLDTSVASKLPVSSALRVAALALGASTTTCPAPVVVERDQPLARAVAALIAQAGGSPDEAALEADASDVPLPLQRALAHVLGAAGRAQAHWASLTAKLSAADLAALGKVHGIHMRTVPGPPSVGSASVQSLFSKRFDMATLADGAVSLALEIERAHLSQFAGTSGFEFEQETPLGRVVIRDAAPHVHSAGPHVLLLVDTGGDDKYLYPAGAVDAVLAGQSDQHVGLAVDLGGRDDYRYDEVPNPRDGKRLPSDVGGRLTPAGPVAEDDGPVSLSEVVRQSGARLGYGMLFDLGDDADSYRSLRFSQGYGASGVGVLFDEGGDDTYEGEAGVQGAAHFGVGLLIDQKGSDTYRSYSQTQGFASVRAIGMLYDGDGDDRYLVDQGDPAEGGDPLYWTPQLPGKGNNSFAQGAAWGRRSPSSDNVDMSGGLGVLRDRKGNDEYVSSVQTQASGYWFGTGILADGAGDDSYDARYYVQGAGAHFAMALFLEGGGNDKYNQKLLPKATSIGVGHDYTVAWHLDLGGNDVYRAPPLSLGSGNANGIGVLVNVGGDDIYRAAAEPTLGAATFSAEWHEACAPCHAVATTGIFVDVGGKDTYEVSSSVARGDGALWSNKRSPAEYAVTEYSAGADRDSANVSLP